MKIFRIFGLLTMITIMAALQPGCDADIKKRKQKDETTGPVRTLASATARLNRNCPEMIDPDTRLDSVILSPGGQLSYYYTVIKQKKASINEAAFQAFLIPLILENVHYNRDLELHRDSGVIMVFNYRDFNGELITEIELGPEKYR